MKYETIVVPFGHCGVSILALMAKEVNREKVFTLLCSERGGCATDGHNGHERRNVSQSCKHGVRDLFWGGKRASTFYFSLPQNIANKTAPRLGIAAVYVVLGLSFSHYLQ